ncbi:MAG: right-handed parallel beta-helix repeat-containing protein, partial [Sedimentisphaerales bacterium]|nr:right-handed parallel beta-helix repeat-containing protein [Sedimentisphaerales bacterium]
GYVYGWGYNVYGQCGNGDEDSEDRELVPVHVHQGQQPSDPCDPADRLKHIIAVSAGEDHSIALEADYPSDANFNGCVYTWGNDTFGPGGDYKGVLGIGDVYEGQRAEPVRVLRGEQDHNDPNQIYLKHIVAISAGWDHSMVLEEYDPFDPCLKGRVYTWGNNENTPYSYGGRLGNGSTTSSGTPVVVHRGQQEPEDPCNPDTSLTRIVAVLAGEGHSMALDVSGYVYTWGDNRYGQLGDGTEEQRLEPVRVAGMNGQGYLSNIVAISAGYWHSLAIDANGTIWTWGKGANGRLGSGNKIVDCNTPYPIPVVYNVTQQTFAFGIQTAIDYAAGGDTLEASPGTYYENVNFLDKTLTLRSEDPNDPQVAAETIIDGFHNYNWGSGVTDSNTVNFGDSSGSILTGMTITMATRSGIWCDDGASGRVSKCIIADSWWHGIYLRGSSVDISDCQINANACDEGAYSGICCAEGAVANVSRCIISSNGGHGIHCIGSTDAVVITNNIIRDNADGGIRCEEFDFGPVIKNNWIYGNDGSGVQTHNPLYPPSSEAIIQNNTIVGNAEYGITSDYAVDAEITSCIIRDNGTGDLYAENGTFDVSYSCRQISPPGATNIAVDPCFVDADANDFHLDGNSPCIDAGNPDFEAEPNETDIDEEERVIGGRVDMGADEFYWSAADVNDNGIVNFIDYALLTAYWRDSGIDYNDVFGFGDSNSVSLAEFCEDWLWQAGWLSGPAPLTAGRDAGTTVETLALEATLSADIACVRQEPLTVEPVDIEAIMQWLADIWLDPEARKSLDADKFLKVYESISRWSER